MHPASSPPRNPGAPKSSGPRRGSLPQALGLFGRSLIEGPTPLHSTRPRSSINLQWLIHLRWAAIGGQLITVFVVRYLLGVEIPLGLLLGVIAVEFGTNAVLLSVFGKLVASAPAPNESSGLDRLQATQLAVTVLDTLFLGVLLGMTGGTSNPFCAFLVIYVALAAVLLPIRHAIAAAVMVALVLVTLMNVSTHIPVLDRGTVLRGWGTVVAIGLTSLLSVYFVSRVTTALVRRSEQLETERERRERRRHLEALGTLAAGAAHELGTPLSTIAIVAKELGLRLERSGASAEELEDAQLIREEVARCRRILDRMSTDSGGGIGEELVPTRPSELADLIVDEMAARDRVVVEVEDLATAEGGEGAERAPFELPRVGLATSVRAIVQNAIDASPEASPVRLVIRRASQSLRILVTDQGGGMSADDIERATEPFFTTKDVGGGMGLGLYLASSFIENLGGALEIRSVLGEGTTVRMEIPMAPTGRGVLEPRASV
ncbi:Sensor histidine kinase RegB [Planctomycetes bacterium Poly30]|uniref:histidine kinase n=1 Tax=Saltatorellus ferox TaxID=2528018 RepID=A0A518EVY7_9BACT|nr:Sensor histidine kinase RegB [Planctomycetes bacterium Poly30]